LNGGELFKKVSKGEDKVPAYLSPELRVLIRAMMKVVPTERPTIDEVANNPWVAATDFDNIECRVSERFLPGIAPKPGQLMETPLGRRLSAGRLILRLSPSKQRR
jgi:hypothetical protein